MFYIQWPCSMRYGPLCESVLHETLCVSTWNAMRFWVTYALQGQMIWWLFNILHGEGVLVGELGFKASQGVRVTGHPRAFQIHYTIQQYSNQPLGLYFGFYVPCFGYCPVIYPRIKVNSPWKNRYIHHYTIQLPRGWKYLTNKSLASPTYLQILGDILELNTWSLWYSQWNGRGVSDLIWPCLCYTFSSIPNWKEQRVFRPFSGHHNFLTHAGPTAMTYAEFRIQWHTPRHILYADYSIFRDELTQGTTMC